MTVPVPGPPRPGMFPPRPGPPPPGRPAPGPAAQPGAAAQPGPAARPAPWPGEPRQRPADSPDHHDGDAGHPAVDAALQSLANAARLSPAEQVAAYEEAHRTLQETLASIDRA